MKQFAVVDTTAADDNLISIWANANDKDRVTASANEADRVLAQTPIEVSEQRVRQFHRFDHPPLRFYYVVPEDDRLVSVIKVARVREQIAAFLSSPSLMANTAANLRPQTLISVRRKSSRYDAGDADQCARGGAP